MKKFTDYSYSVVEKQGWYDGSSNVWRLKPFWRSSKTPYPLIEQETTALFEEELLESGDDWVAETANQWKQFDEKIKPRYCAALGETSRLKAKLQLETEEAKVALANFDKARADFFDFSKPLISKTKELIFMFALLVVEFPLNAEIFSIFGAGKIATYVMACGICIVIPLAAYYLGFFLRLHNKTLIQICWCVIIPLTIFIVLFGISFVRASLFEAQQTHSILHLKLTPEHASSVFLAINIAYFVVATAISYASGHNDPSQYSKINHIYEDAKKSMQKETREEKEASKAYAAASEKYETLKQQRSKKHEALVAEAKRRIEEVEWKVSVYRKANMALRMDSVTPKCFNVKIRRLIMPVILDDGNLDWDCQNTNASIVNKNIFKPGLN